MQPDTSFELPGFEAPRGARAPADPLAPRSDIKNSYTPKDLDEESYGLTRSPTANELDELAEGLEKDLKYAAPENRPFVISNRFMHLLSKLTKGCE